MFSTSTGRLKPQLRKKSGQYYEMRESECHGLKELITLLTVIFDNEHNCLIIDEPELHLHPQFQTFLLQQIRELSGDPREDPNKKMFLLITHSPFMVDIRTVEDLDNCIFFQPGQRPSFVETKTLHQDDQYKLKRLLPRLNTHHKQFFFSSSPIFVEGYTDQQLFSLIQERRRRMIGAVGSCFIDVTGKDELALFFRLSKCLNIHSKFIADLDALLGGQLRQVTSHDDDCRQFVQDKGMAIDGMDVIGKMQTQLGDCLNAFEALSVTSESPLFVRQMHEAIAGISSEVENAKRQRRKEYVILLGILKHHEVLSDLLPSKKELITLIRGITQQLIDGFEHANVYLLSEGQLENYLPSYEGNPFLISDSFKREVFETERTALLENLNTEKSIVERFPELVAILDRVAEAPEVTFEVQLLTHIADWIHKVQKETNRNRSHNIESLLSQPSIEHVTYNRLFEVEHFESTRDGFTCRIKLKPSLDEMCRIVEFNQDTVPTKIGFRNPT